MRSSLKKYWTLHGIPLLLSVPLGLLAVVAARYAIGLPGYYDGFVNRQSSRFICLFTAEGIQTLIVTLSAACALVALTWLAGLIIGFVRKAWALSFLRTCYIAGYLLVVLFAFSVFRITGIIVENDLKLAGAASPPDAIRVFYWRHDLIWPLLLLAAAIAALHVISWRRRTLDIYTGGYDTGYHERTPAPGDHVVENLRTHGRDPRFRKSIAYSVFIHFAAIILIPWLLQLGGCVDPYRVPEGSGNPVISFVKLVKPKKKPKKKIFVNPKSAISFHIPTVDESQLEQEVEDKSQLTYAADASAVHKLGGGGKKGGWPDGMKNGLVRFIRLEYDGESWDDGMDAALRADINFLEEFKKATGFKVAAHGESNPINLLDNYPKGFAPPFVYMTGSGRINISPQDMKILREYLLDGGMLFADCGSRQWNASFRAFIQALFPGEPLLVVADDDPIFQMPYVFANGAPPLWHHGGSRALGIKRGGRWVVFYHPGDVNDAWKTGHSGVSPELTSRAYELGINILYHAFTRYLEATRKYRK
jgi:hypothetical protein